MSRRPSILGFLTLISLVSLGLSQAPPPSAKDTSAEKRAIRGNKLKRDLQDTKVTGIWHYNDWESAKTAAQKANKPIFVLFR